MSTPAFRGDIKGEVGVFIADCTASMRGEIQTAEMRRTFRQALAS